MPIDGCIFDFCVICQVLLVEGNNVKRGYCNCEKSKGDILFK